MRLTCPTCGARYDVDDGMIPAGGRDVQCSNCNATWFQLGTPRPAATVKPLRTAPSAAGGDMPAEEASATGSAARGGGEDEDPLDVLREERRHEDRVRQAEGKAGPDPVGDGDDADGSTPSVDPALGRMLAGRRPLRATAPEEEPSAAGARERARIAAAAALARSRDRDAARGTNRDEDGGSGDASAAAFPTATHDGEAPAGGRAGRPRPTPRRDLPDIAEADDRAASGRSSGRVGRRDRARRGGGFWIGFILVLALAAILVAVYLFAADIAGAVPGLAASLGDYTAAVDAGRAALARSMDALAAWLRTVAA